MDEQKSFWKKYEFLIIAVIALMLIYLIVIFNQKINFLLGNELIVNLAPEQKSFTMYYGDARKAEFDVSIENVAYCKAFCSYSFNDRSANQAIDKGTFEIEKDKYITKSYELSIKRLGSGQDIYSFEVNCHIMRSFLCLGKSAEKSKSSFVTVNYDLTETEKELKKILKQNVTKLLELLSEVDVLHQQANQKYFELGFKVNLNSITKHKIGIDDLYDETRISIENLRSLWSVEAYTKLNSLFNQSFFETLIDIKASIGDFDKLIGDIVKLHNGILVELNDISKKLEELGAFANVLRSDNISEDFEAAAAKFNEISNSLANNTFDNYEDMADAIGNLTQQHNSLIEKSKMPSASLFFNYEYNIKHAGDLLCTLKQDCKDDISILKIVNDSKDFIAQYPNSGLLRQSCNSIRELNQKYFNIRNETSAFIEDKNISFPSDSEFIAFSQEFKDNEIRKINNSHYESLESIRSENRTNADVIKIAEKILPDNLSAIKSLYYNESANVSLYLLSKLELHEDALQLLSRCSNLDKPSSIGDFSFEPVNESIEYDAVSRIDTTLSDNPPICCVFNECKPCCRDEACRNDPKTFPVIFIHGHSFAKGNSPEFSLDTFNKLQSKLQEDGYLNAGIVSLYSQNEPVQKGVWGLSGKPVTVKVSYYYDAFRKEESYIVVPTKSESIDTYALRLKDLIEIVKDRTDKPKVNVIAHSMGGLVARRYMQIFGDSDIYKLTMIAVPNKGISAETAKYCGIIGENRECQDMLENGLFINKLNDPLKQPDKAELYSIIGNGCKTDSSEGDGVVTTASAKLENAELYYANGTCNKFGQTLHTEILDIEKYPQTYEVISEILKG